VFIAVILSIGTYDIVGTWVVASDKFSVWFAGNAVKTSLGFFFILICGMTGAGAYAGNTLGRDWAGACSSCHGTEGRSVGVIPPIAGMQKDRFVQLMTAFRNGTRRATVMHQHARGLSDEQIDLIGDYFASRSSR
jgi:sulfide dehydrogenase cytochrome subunit